MDDEQAYSYIIHCKFPDSIYCTKRNVRSCYTMLQLFDILPRYYVGRDVHVTETDKFGLPDEFIRNKPSHINQYPNVTNDKPYGIELVHKARET